MAVMKPGELLETALWMTGRETPEQAEDAKATITRAFEDASARQRLVIGPVTFEEKRPGDDRVPQVPDHVQGPDVRLLVATAEVVGHLPEVKLHSFLAELEPSDLEILRRLTRQTYERAYPGQTLSDEQCDSMIEQVGPDSAMAAVREAVDGGRIH